MKKRAKIIKILPLLFLLNSSFIIHHSSLHALPLTQARVSGGRSAIIATIDLEKVFRAYPATKQAKEELEKLILIKENEIASKRSEIFQVMVTISNLKAADQRVRETTPAQEQKPQVAIATTTLALPTTSQALPGIAFVEPEQAQQTQAPDNQAVSTKSIIDEKEKELRGLEEELRHMERNIEDSLIDLEEAQTKTIMAAIYTSLKELAEEKNVDMIVDKNAILWGAPHIDLTELLLAKLKTRLIEIEGTIP
ncbi:OmpH family outer membrane protein [Elusimicrobiota bacterium]